MVMVVVRFSARYTGAARVMLWFTLVATTILAVALNALLWSAEASGPDAEVATWGLRTIGFLFLLGVLRVLATLRFDVRLVGDRLVRQGALWRRSVSLPTAKLHMRQTTWLYAQPGAPFSGRRLAVPARILVARSFPLRAIALPLLQRHGHRLVDGRVAVAWLPPNELAALADAIAPNRPDLATLIRTLR